MVVGLQIAIILISRGDVYVLGEAYAFGVMWSFVFNSTVYAGAALQVQGRARLEGAAQPAPSRA